MSKEFEDLMRRAICQMRVMLRERRRFNVLAKELETFTSICTRVRIPLKKDVTDRQ